MTAIDTADDMQTDGFKIEEVIQLYMSGRTMLMKITAGHAVSMRIKAE